jgi:enoyl-CoA hydratase/carnithine racemase
MFAFRPPMNEPERRFHALQIGREGRVRTLRLNSPATRNLLDPPMLEALAAALEGAAADPGTGAVLLLQSGEVFCAGADLAAPGNAELQARYSGELFRLFAAPLWHAKPVLAAVRGACAGAGVGILCRCHFVLAAQGAKFGVTEIHSGLWPFPYYEAMTAALGGRRACELALTGRAFSAADALSFGLVHELVPPFELEDRAMQMAQTLAALSPAAVSAGLRLASGGAQARALWDEALQSPDFAEGAEALRERRRPRWPSAKSGETEKRARE